MIRFACPDCRRTLEVAEERGGNTVHCPSCGRPLCVPTLLPVGAALGPAFAPARAQPWWSFGSPAAQLAALVLFFLPWVEVRCDRPFDDRGTPTLAHQSGLQAAYGGYTELPHSPSARAEFNVEERLRPLQGEVAVSAAPLTAAYALVLLGGCLLGFLVRCRARVAAMVGCSAAAGLLLLIQAVRGFPLEQVARTLDTKGRVAGADFRFALNTSGWLEVGTTRWFWLSAAAVGGALALAVAEWKFARGPRAVREF